MAEPFLTATLNSFLLLFIIIDPFLSLAVFISLTKKMSAGERAMQALLAVSVALGLLLVFLFIGLPLLGLLGITMPSFRVAGGLILLIMGVQTVLGIEFTRKNGGHKVAAVVIGTPLLSGPGALTTIILLGQRYGYLPEIVASLAVIALTWLILLFSNRIARFLGERLIEVFSRVLGLILAAMGAEFIKEGVVEMVRSLA